MSQSYMVKPEGDCVLVIGVTLYNTRLRTLSCNLSLYYRISFRRLCHLNLNPSQTIFCMSRTSLVLVKKLLGLLS